MRRVYQLASSISRMFRVAMLVVSLRNIVRLISNVVLVVKMVMLSAPRIVLPMSMIVLLVPIIVLTIPKAFPRDEHAAGFGRDVLKI